MLKRCACIDTLYTEKDFYERFAAAKADGFEAVEFWDWRIRDLDKVRDAAQAAGINISGFNGDNDSKKNTLKISRHLLTRQRKSARKLSRFIQTRLVTAVLSSTITTNFPTPLNFALCTIRCLHLSNSPKNIKSA